MWQEYQNNIDQPPHEQTHKISFDNLDPFFIISSLHYHISGKVYIYLLRQETAKVKQKKTDKWFYRISV